MSDVFQLRGAAMVHHVASVLAYFAVPSSLWASFGGAVSDPQDSGRPSVGPAGPKAAGSFPVVGDQIQAWPKALPQSGSLSLMGQPSHLSRSKPTAYFITYDQYNLGDQVADQGKESEFPVMQDAARSTGLTGRPRGPGMEQLSAHPAQGALTSILRRKLAARAPLQSCAEKLSEALVLCAPREWNVSPHPGFVQNFENRFGDDQHPLGRLHSVSPSSA
eukprot:s2496_g9.t1